MESCAFVLLSLYKTKTPDRGRGLVDIVLREQVRISGML